MPTHQPGLVGPCCMMEVHKDESRLFTHTLYRASCQRMPSSICPRPSPTYPAPYLALRNDPDSLPVPFCHPVCVKEAGCVHGQRLDSSNAASTSAAPRQRPSTGRGFLQTRECTSPSRASSASAQGLSGRILSYSLSRGVTILGGAEVTLTLALRPSDCDCKANRCSTVNIISPRHHKRSNCTRCLHASTRARTYTHTHTRPLRAHRDISDTVD